MIIERKQRMTAFESVGADQKVRQNAAGTRVALFPSTRCVALKGPPRFPPNGLVEIPLNLDAGFSEEHIQERFATARGSQQFSEDSGCCHQSSALQRIV